VHDETVHLHLKAVGLVLSRPQHTITSRDPKYALKKAIEAERDQVEPEARVFYYADEFSLCWLTTLTAMWSPQGQQVMIRTPAQPRKHYSFGAVDYHTGQTAVVSHWHKRRRDIAELLDTILVVLSTGTIDLAWDNVTTHEDKEVEAEVRGTAGRLVLLDLPTYTPWLHPIEMLWRHFRREVTRCEQFSSVAALIAAAHDFFDRYHRVPHRMRSISGSHPPELL